MYLFEGLKQKVLEYLPADRVQLVQESFVLAQEAHDGQMRSSGDPYITHPVAVAGILADMHLDHETIMAALLHDVIEDTHYSKEDLAEAFGDTVAMMAMVQDIRVILIKLADRTHNMRTLGSLRPDKRRRIALETLEIYAPIAHRLGIHDIKNELEDLGFQAMYPIRPCILCVIAH